MKIAKICIYVAAAVAMAVAASSCDDGKSYAELLNEQDMYVNNYLADHIVMLDVPADTVFEYGPDAPFYRLDEDGNMYMQVLEPGTKGNKVRDDEQIYFRYTRYALINYKDGKLPTGAGNNITLSPAWFRFNNYQLQSSAEWGVGIQTPLQYLPVDCKVNIVIKSEYGITSESSNVQPYLWTLTYERRR